LYYLLTYVEQTNFTGMSRTYFLFNQPAVVSKRQQHWQDIPRNHPDDAKTF